MKNNEGIFLKRKEHVVGFVQMKNVKSVIVYQYNYDSRYGCLSHI